MRETATRQTEALRRRALILVVGSLLAVGAACGDTAEGPTLTADDSPAPTEEAPVSETLAEEPDSDDPSVGSSGDDGLSDEPDEPSATDPEAGDDFEAETHGPGVIPPEFALDGEAVAWRAAHNSVARLFTELYAPSGLGVDWVSGDVVMTLGGGLMAIDYESVTISFDASAALPDVVIDGSLVGTLDSRGDTVAFTGQEGGLVGTSTILGEEIVIPVAAEDLPLGTTEFVFEFDTSGERLVTTVSGDAVGSVYFPDIWLRVH